MQYGVVPTGYPVADLTGLPYQPLELESDPEFEWGFGWPGRRWRRPFGRFPFFPPGLGLPYGKPFGKPYGMPYGKPFGKPYGKSPYGKFI